ncbi:MAG: hypothetical protein HC822_12430 [Oscillochloris sp.]|nr:hypothetical protein [Oscillochloris sp.]
MVSSRRKPASLGRFRWAGATATITLSGGDPHGVLLLRGAQAPGARVSVAAGDSKPLVLPETGGEIRRISLLLPRTPDPFGAVSVHISADPPAQIAGRALSLALSEAAILPLRGTPLLPPLGALLLLYSLALLSGALCLLAGTTVRLAGICVLVVGLLLAVFWPVAPQAVDAWLRDLAFFLTAGDVWRWWLLVFLAAFALWPLTRLLFDRLPHAGYPLARVVALVIITWLAWAAAVARLVPFAVPALIATALVLAGITWGLALRRRLPLWPPALGLRAALGWELLFLAGLFAGSRLRWFGAVGPALTGTEKPMEIAMLGAVMNGGFFPPIDPWFAGYGLNYYYLGYVTIGGLGLLGDTPPAVAFNLGFALTVALTLIGVAYAGWILAPQRASAPLLGAGLAVMLALVAGSQAGALQLATGSYRWRALDAGQLAEALIQRLQGAETMQLSRPTPPSWDGPPFDTITVAAQPFDWFQASRAIYDDIELPAGGVERRYAITEFPAFSLYLGDLHPHVLAMPLNLAAIALALALAREPSRPLLGAAGMLAGTLYAVNAWDAPVYAVLLAGALLLGRRADLPRRWRTLGADLLVFAAAALLAALPFLLTFVPPAGPLRSTPFESLALVGRLSAAFGISTDRTPLHSFLALFALPLVPLLALAFSQRVRQPWLAPVALLLVLAIGVLLGFPLLFLAVPAAVLIIGAWRATDSAVAVLHWIAAVGAIAVLLPELVYLRDHLEGEMSRMITIFKFVYQAWLLWAVAAAAAITTLLHRPLSPLRTLAWGLPTLLLLFGALVYPYGLLRWAEPWRAGERSYDGLAFLAREAPAELAATRWLAANVGRDDVVLSGYCTCDYELVSRVGAISAAPTLLGWMDGHERVWRSGDPAQLAEMARRERDLPHMFNNPAVSSALLAQYSVDYVYIGPVERRLYPAEGLESLALRLEPVFSRGAVTIYRVP